jgi:hypothetical protein
VPTDIDPLDFSFSNDLDDVNPRQMAVTDVEYHSHGQPNPLDSTQRVSNAVFCYHGSNNSEDVTQRNPALLSNPASVHHHGFQSVVSNIDYPDNCTLSPPVSHRKTVSVMQSVPLTNVVATITPATDDLVNDGLDTQGFIYEEPKPTYWQNKTKLDCLGPFNQERWDHMCCIHFLSFPT